MARGFPDYITNRIKGLSGPQFRNITSDIEMTAEGQMPVQNHFNQYDLSGYFPAQANYQVPMNYQEPPNWFEGMDQMFQAGHKFVREAGESFIQQFEQMHKMQEYQPEPMPQDMLDTLMQQHNDQMANDMSYQGQLDAMDIFNQSMQGNLEPNPNQQMTGLTEQANMEIEAAIEQAGGVADLMFENPGIEPMILRDPGPEVPEPQADPQEQAAQPEPAETETPATLEDIVMQEMRENAPGPDGMMDNPMGMFFPGM